MVVIRISPVAAQESFDIHASIAVAASAAKPNFIVHRETTIVGARPAWPEDAETRRLLSIPTSSADLAW